MESAFVQVGASLLIRFRQEFIGRFTVVVLVLAWLCAGTFAAFAESVLVEGNQRVDSETIASYFTGTDQSSINRGVKELYATGLFASVKVSRAGGRVVITVAENNVINRVAFEGNSKVKTETLAAEIQSKSRGPYSRAMVDADIERIKDVYRRSGRAAASVTVRTVDLPNGRVDVVFTVDEGDKTGVKTINFVGNHAYSEGKLRDLMQTTEMNLFSFFKTSDVYDPDRIASDLELIRRFYLKNGYADFRIVGSDAQFDPEQGGYIITITLEEGVQYTVGSVNVESHFPTIDSASLQPLVRISAGDTYNGDMVQKTVDALTKELGKRGYPFTQVRPRGDRDPATRTVSIVFVLDEGPRVYIERIDVHGNSRTRDYVIRREFEIGEGDAYNRVLIDRAERRLNNLGYFKKVRITNEPGSAPDRVIVVVEVEDQPTGSLSLSGGFSTTTGFIADVSVTETNFMGRGQFVRLAVSAGQYSRGVDFSFTEPYFLGYRLAAGFDLYAKKSNSWRYSFYDNFVTGATLRLGLPITEELSFSPRYSIYRTDISIPNNSARPFNDCSSPIPFITPGFPFGAPTLLFNCLTNSEASLAIKEAQGPFLTSMLGYTVGYNTLDNIRNPTSGLFIELRQDVAGAGGDARFLRTTGDLRYYRELYDQFVGLVHLQGGDIESFGGYRLRVVDNFNMGPTLVRGFAPFGIGPRDTSFGLNPQGNPLGGTKYYGASLEVQFPVFGVPRDLGLKGAVFADAGTLYGFEGQTQFPPFNTCFNPFVSFTQSNCLTVGGNSPTIRTSAGGSIIWSSPLGPIRFDFAKAITKSPSDITQFFRFTGGTTF
ncbi:MAG: outer membrane protein assembly factor BamA [Verrucomicrobia subdivision 3 bacterium]|nr:outer membrane protein assembly factor BamA [Limisphaerales bacterium]